LLFSPERIEKTHVYFESAGLILVFISFGKYFEAKTKGKAGDAVKKLAGLQAKSALVERAGEEIDVPISDIVVGDIIIVKVGEKIPVDGIIISGASTIDESSITGESIPVGKKIGDVVIGGTINKTRVFKFRTTKIGSDTLLANIIKIVEDATASKAPIQLLADKVSFYFVPIVMFMATISFFAWFFAGYGIGFALTTFVSVLIIACPCSMGLATPTAVMMGTGIAAQRGILIKSSYALEVAHKVNTIVFDKTGTLTKGKPEIVTVKYYSFDEEVALALASGLSKQSHHPISLALTDFATSKNITPIDVCDVSEIEGKGITGQTEKDKTRILLGNEKLLQENGIVSFEKNKDINDIASDGQTPLCFSYGGKIVAIFGVRDEVKDEAKEAIERLKKTGKKIMMITGDKIEVARAIGNKLGINDVLAEVLPQEKSTAIKELQRQGKIVAMVGDGINDAPALAQADLGIALGSGTDIALEAGEIILVKSNLLDVAKAIEISAYTFKKIRENLFWAFCYNIAGIPIAGGVLYPFTGFLLNPMVAAIAMSFSSISVVSNSLLMKFRKF
ncbi:MAG: copper-translocating P-type ATPase, partial [Deltaproteobacteria bacterium]